eukprot:3939211-Rhodomonas_salina.4
MPEEDGGAILPEVGGCEDLDRSLPQQPSKSPTVRRVRVTYREKKLSEKGLETLQEPPWLHIVVEVCLQNVLHALRIVGDDKAVKEQGRIARHRGSILLKKLCFPIEQPMP